MTVIDYTDYKWSYLCSPVIAITVKGEIIVQLINCVLQGFYNVIKYYCLKIVDCNNTTHS